MKQFLIFLISFSTVLLVVSCGPIPKKDYQTLEGSWITNDYSCGSDTGIVEIIQVSKIGNCFFAIKRKGDDCIQTGDTTWFGCPSETGGLVTIKGKNPDTGELFYGDVVISIQDDKHISILFSDFSIDYERICT